MIRPPQNEINTHTWVARIFPAIFPNHAVGPKINTHPLNSGGIASAGSTSLFQTHTHSNKNSSTFFFCSPGPSQDVIKRERATQLAGARDKNWISPTEKREKRRKKEKK